MNTPQIFEHEYFGSLRTVMIDGEPHFAGKDVATALGFVDTVNAIKLHCKGVVKRHPLQTAGGTQDVRVIAEADVYLLVIGSVLPAAQKFREWLASVAVELRKTGVVDLRGNKPVIDLDDPDNVLQLAQALTEKLNEKNLIIHQQNTQLEDTVPKADYHDMMMVRDKEMGLREFGKSVQMSQDEFMAFLKEHGYRLKTNDRIEMMQKYIDTGLFVVREVMCRDNKMRPQVMVTPKGQEVLKKHIMQLRRELDL